MRSFLVFLALAFWTPYYVARFIIVEFIGLGDRDGSLTYHAGWTWGKWICWGAGVRVVAPEIARVLDGKPRVLVVNHTSWFDVFSTASVIPGVGFIAKAEMSRIPIFGRAMRTAGMLFVDRDNHKAAFAAYDDAAVHIRNGKTVLIFPEGTRGTSYELRPFKKGPFVLAIAAGVPIVPILVHGTREVLPRGSWWVRAGVVHVHVLDEIPTAGCTYQDRNRLAQQARDAMRAAQQQLYKIDSPAWNPDRSAARTLPVPSVSPPQA